MFSVINSSILRLVCKLFKIAVKSLVNATRRQAGIAPFYPYKAGAGTAAVPWKCPGFVYTPVLEYIADVLVPSAYIVLCIHYSCIECRYEHSLSAVLFDLHNSSHHRHAVIGRELCLGFCSWSLKISKAQGPCWNKRASVMGQPPGFITELQINHSELWSGGEH